MKSILFLLAFLPILAQGQPSRNLYFDPVSHIITEDTTTNPVCLERGHVWKITNIKATKACEPYIVDNLYYTIKVYPACDLTRQDCIRCGVRRPSTAMDWVDTIWRKPGIKRTIKADTTKWVTPGTQTSYTANPIQTRDTIPVIMLVCDTTEIDTQNMTLRLNLKTDIKFSQIVFWLRGYEVRKVSKYLGGADPNPDGTVYAVTVLRNRYDHVAYLDSNKKPVKYLVWMSKEVGK